MTEASKEYATALFALACEEREEEKVMEALDRVAEILGGEPTYRAFLTSPGISLAERLASIDAVFGTTVPTRVLSYLKLLCEKRKTELFFDSVTEYRRLYDQHRSVSVARVVSAVALTDEEKRRLEEKLTAVTKRRVQLTLEIDPSLLGGMTVEIDGKIIDGSLRHRLREVKEVMKQ